MNQFVWEYCTQNLNNDAHYRYAKVPEIIFPAIRLWR